MFRLMIVVTLIHISSTVALSDDSYDDDPALFLEPRTSKYRSQKPFHFKEDYHGLDNFFRFGRSQADFLPFLEDLEEYGESTDEFARPTRSQDRNDNFVRFGRGNSDFVRFGRDSYKLPRDMRSDNFLRFGRGVSESELPKKRSRRDVSDKYESKARRGADRDNFLRFGRGGDDSFIRYGRNPDGSKTNGDETLPAPTKPHPFTSKFVHGQSINYPFSLNGRLLHNSPLLSILRKLEEEMRQSN